MQRRFGFVVATAIVTAIIVYGSLYSFDFVSREGGLGAAFQALVDSGDELPSRSDLLANILLYMPFGFFALLALGGGRGTAAKIVLVTLCGGLLSIAMELAQYFDPGRVTNASDVYTNSAGALFGAIAASSAGLDFRRMRLPELGAQPAPALLLAAWIGYRLYPFVPTIDLHKYWDALKPVVLYPSLTGYDLFRYTAIWLAVGALIEAIVGPRRSLPMLVLFVGAVLVGKVMIVDASLHLAEIAGALVAILGYGLLAFNRRFRSIVLALLFCACVVAERLEPFAFGPFSRPFNWTPFWGFMSGALDIDILSFLQKFFLYGGAVWLLAEAGLRLRTATLLVAAALFLTSVAEQYLPGRSAEITDALMTLIIGAVFALLGARSGAARRSEMSRR